MGTLYRHFPTKEALLDAAAGARFHVVGRAGGSRADRRAWPDLAWFLGDALTRQTASPGPLDAYCQALPSQAGNTARQHCRQQVGPLIAEQVLAAREAGELRPDVTAEDVSLLLVALGRIAPWFPNPPGAGCSRLSWTACARPRTRPCPPNEHGQPEHTGGC